MASGGGLHGRPSYTVQQIADYPDLLFAPEYCPCGRRLWGFKSGYHCHEHLKACRSWQCERRKRKAAYDY